jgi:D-3-phosphoglycerate dehydrogenase / 2-oxoglutarate reductase
MARKVLVTDHVFESLDIERSVLAPLGVEVELATDQGEDALVAAAEDAVGLLVCFAPVTRAVVEAAARGGTRLIARYGIGYDNVDVEAATELGIVVTNVPDYCLDEVADHTIALLLAHARGVVRGASSTAAGEWAIPHAEIHRLAGRRLALIGVGAIGRRVAARALAFGLEVVAYDPYLSPWDVDGVGQVATIEEAVAEADFVSLHAPLTADNVGLVGERLIGAMTRRPLLVNTARGGLVDLEAAARALDAGVLGGVALDVTDPEPPPPDHPLRSDPRAILTPHMAFHSIEATDELQSRAVAEVARSLAGEPPDRPVDPEALERR